MATDLTKMVEEFNKQCPSEHLLTPVLEALAAEIRANRKEIEKLKAGVIPTGTVKPDQENVRALKVDRSK